MGTTEEEKEKMKRAVELAKRVDITSLVKVFVSLLRAYGNMAKAVGTIQLEHKDSFEALTYLGVVAPQLMERIVEKAPPEIVGLFMKILMKMTVLGPKMGKIMELPAKEKVKIGEELNDYAEDFEKLLKLMETAE